MMEIMAVCFCHMHFDRCNDVAEITDCVQNLRLSRFVFLSNSYNTTFRFSHTALTIADSAKLVLTELCCTTSPLSILSWFPAGPKLCGWEGRRGVWV